jgi:cytochrome c oxidase subunit 2
MVSWAALSDLELASIVTYERNAWGNDTGDVVQPKDIEAARSRLIK